MTTPTQAQIEAAANQIEKIAMEIPPPNEYTPRLMMAAIAVRRAAAEIGMVDSARTTGHGQTGGISPSIPTQAQIKILVAAIKYALLRSPWDSDSCKIQTLEKLRSALTAAAEAGKQKDSDLNDVLMGFTNYVMNERVRSYNEGTDATIEQCAQKIKQFAKSSAVVYRGTEPIGIAESKTGEPVVWLICEYIESAIRALKEKP